ncbi:MAG: PAS domain-containing protein, partial [Planctomycetota bacterium]
MLRAIDSYQLSQFVIAVLASYVTCQHLLLLGRRRQLELDGVFAALSLSLAGYAILRVVRYDSHDVAVFTSLLWWMWLLLLTASYCYIHFLVVILERGRRWLLPLTAGICLLLFVRHIISPEGFAVSGLGSPVSRSGWGMPDIDIPLHMNAGYAVFAGLILLATGWGLTLAWQRFLQQRALRHGSLAIAISLITASIVGSIGTDLGLWQSPILIHHAFIALVVAMNLAFADEAARTAELAEALTRSEEDLRATLEAISDALIVTDPSGRVIWLNPAAEELLQHEATSTVNHPLHELLELRDAENGEPVPCSADRVLSSQQAVSLTDHGVLIRADGSQRRIA